MGFGEGEVYRKDFESKPAAVAYEILPASVVDA